MNPNDTGMPSDAMAAAMAAANANPQGAPAYAHACQHGQPAQQAQYAHPQNAPMMPPPAAPYPSHAQYAAQYATPQAQPPHAAYYAQPAPAQPAYYPPHYAAQNAPHYPPNYPVPYYPNTSPYPPMHAHPNYTLTHQLSNGLSSFFDFKDERFLKGAIVGAAATFLLTNDSVQKSAIKSVVKIWSLFQGGVEEMKERFRDAEAEIKSEEQHK
jgi:hypothetical protein